MGVTARREMARVKHRWRGGQTEGRCEDEDRTGGHRDVGRREGDRETDDSGLIAFFLLCVLAPFCRAGSPPGASLHAHNPGKDYQRPK